jgi:hypothetical protein
MGSEKNEKETVLCPVGRFFMDLEKTAGERSAFFEHLNNSRVEFLKAVRALVDERIGHLEGKGQTRDQDRMTKIEVE